MFQQMRRRLALWYGGVTAVLLLVFALAGYLYVQTTLSERIDDTLDHVAEVVVATLPSEPPQEPADVAEDRVALGLNYWWGHPHTRPVSPAELTQALTQAKWLELDATCTELYLGLCWGDPKEYYQWARPASGCDRVVAAQALLQAIKV